MMNHVGGDEVEDLVEKMFTIFAQDTSAQKKINDCSMLEAESRVLSQRRKREEKRTTTRQSIDSGRDRQRRSRRSSPESGGLDSKKGSMDDQGLSQSDYNFEQDHGRFKETFEARILEEDSIKFGGKSFHKDECYLVDNDNLADGREEGRTPFAIKNFLQSDSALCVELVRFNETVLETVQDTSGMEKRSPKNIGKFVQRANTDNEIPLENLEEKLENEKIPDFKYFPKEKGTSARRFALVDSSKQQQRNGPRKSRLRAIDFYAGAGLASRGFEDLGFEIIAGIEKDSDAVQSYKQIHGAEIFDVNSEQSMDAFIKNPEKAIFHNTTEEFLTKYRNDMALKKALGSVDIVIFCPPCQGFSAENRLNGGNADQNNEESLRIKDAAELIRPKLIVFENVFGMWREKHIKDYVQPIVYGLVDNGYNVQFGWLCAADFGDAQKRPRVILIASLSHIGLPVFPNPTHGQSLLPYVTVRDTLRNEEGKHPEDEKPIDDDDEKRDPNQPAGTVKASKSALHYRENRRYSLEENAMLMGEGPEFVSKLVGNRASKQRQIGNGVPRELARALGQAARGVLKWNWEGEDNELDDVSRNENISKPEEIKSEFKTHIKPEETRSEFKSDTKPNIKLDMNP